MFRNLAAVVAVLVCLTLTGVEIGAADVLWHPLDSSLALPQTRVQGEIEILPLPGGLRLRGWVVDGFSATRADVIELRNGRGDLLGAVVSGEFQRRRDVEQRFGSSAYSLSGFDATIPNPPQSIIVLAHLGELGWWRTYVTAPVQPRATVSSLTCAAPDVVEVEITSADAFPVRNALLQLTIGDQITSISRYSPGGDLHTVIFSLSAVQFAAISPSDDAYVSYDPPSPTEYWEIGPIDPTTAGGCDQAVRCAAGGPRP